MFTETILYEKAIIIKYMETIYGNSYNKWLKLKKMKVIK